ncbi:hypothetical protein LP419_06940 [Massilia sp. H-1]|nr:hypothetical protein LP419_06940 [Massilia sp. H-1]
MPCSDAAFAAAAAAAADAGDNLRTLLAEAAIARWAVLRDRNTAVARWGGRFNSDAAAAHPSLATWVNDFLALAASQAGDFGAAMPLLHPLLRVGPGNGPAARRHHGRHQHRRRLHAAGRPSLGP